MRFARRTHQQSATIFDELLTHLQDPDMISFSGGFPASSLLPQRELGDCAQAIFKDHASQALSYNSTQGYYPLRQWIVERYKKIHDLDLDPSEILITTGSQQGIDLLSKVFLDPMDHILVESPSYLGALQAFNQYEPRIHDVKLNENGIDVSQLMTYIRSYHPKLIYMVPNFQNPTGICYTQENKENVVQNVKAYDVILVEDDPYGELRYEGKKVPLFKSYLPNQSIILGTFSKLVSPGMRIGWMVAPKPIMEKLYAAKEASDLHTSALDQHILYHYLSHYDYDGLIQTAINHYRQRRDWILEAILKHFPRDVKVSHPEGGMFIWCTLPNGMSAMNVFRQAITLKVLIMPGMVFYHQESDDHSFRLSFTSVDQTQINEGISRLGALLRSHTHP